jgi:hypothetical protein
MKMTIQASLIALLTIVTGEVKRSVESDTMWLKQWVMKRIDKHGWPLHVLRVHPWRKNQTSMVSIKAEKDLFKQ